MLTPDIKVIDGSEAERVNPLLRPGVVELAMLEPGALDVDVHALHQGYVCGFQARGGRIVTSAALVEATRSDRVWTIVDRGGNRYETPTVVNAAGVWCDEVAGLLGVTGVGIQPLRRSVFMVPAPDVADNFYFKPEQQHLLCSPSDETPQTPADARPESRNCLCPSSASTRRGAIDR